MTWTSDGKWNGAYYFDGVNDSINLGNRSSFNTLHQNNKKFSAGAWIYFMSGYGVIFSNNDLGYMMGWSFYTR